MLMCYLLNFLPSTPSLSLIVFVNVLFCCRICSVRRWLSCDLLFFRIWFYCRRRIKSVPRFVCLSIVRLSLNYAVLLDYLRSSLIFKCCRRRALIFTVYDCNAAPGRVILFLFCILIHVAFTISVAVARCLILLLLMRRFTQHSLWYTPRCIHSQRCLPMCIPFIVECLSAR